MTRRLTATLSKLLLSMAFLAISASAANAQGTFLCECPPPGGIPAVIISQSCQQGYTSDPSFCPVCRQQDGSQERLMTCVNQNEQVPNPPGEVLQPVSQEFLNEVNPLFSQASNPVFEANNLKPATLFNRIMTFAFPIAGLILLVMIVVAGLEIVLGATNKKTVDTGRERLGGAILGFGLLFISYWVVRLIEIIFNVTIFG